MTLAASDCGAKYWMPMTTSSAATRIHRIMAMTFRTFPFLGLSSESSSSPNTSSKGKFMFFFLLFSGGQDSLLPAAFPACLSGVGSGLCPRPRRQPSSLSSQSPAVEFCPRRLCFCRRLACLCAGRCRGLFLTRPGRLVFFRFDYYALRRSGQDYPTNSRPLFFFFFYWGFSGCPPASRPSTALPAAGSVFSSNSAMTCSGLRPSPAPAAPALPPVPRRF